MSMEICISNLINKQLISNCKCMYVYTDKVSTMSHFDSNLN